MTSNDILPGVLKVLDYLQEKQIPMALGSASKNAQPILKRVGLFDRFDSIVDGNHVTKAKPDPEVFTIGADALGGAVNITTDNAVKKYFNASYSIGSFNTHRASISGKYTT